MKNTWWCFMTFFWVLLCNAQSQQFEINWEGSKVFSSAVSNIELPYFDAKHYNYSKENGITFTAQWNAGFEINLTNASLLSIESEIIPLSDLKNLKLSSIPQSFQYKVYNTKSRGKASNTIVASALFKEDGFVRKVKRFTISYKKNTFQRVISANAQLQSSVLKSGQWYRFRVDTTGVFKLTKNFFRDLGINTGTVNPKNIKIFGQGGKSLPLANNQTIAYDLIENAVKFVGEEDSVFNDEDYLLFYAIGPKYYNEENNSHINPYSDVAYYYVQISSGNGLRVNPANSPTGNADITFSTFHDYKFIESDEYNIGQMGGGGLVIAFILKMQEPFLSNFQILLLKIH